jgi:hypothetical protein
MTSILKKKLRLPDIKLVLKLDMWMYHHKKKVEIIFSSQRNSVC